MGRLAGPVRPSRRWDHATAAATIPTATAATTTVAAAAQTGWGEAAAAAAAAASHVSESMIPRPGSYAVLERGIKVMIR